MFFRRFALSNIISLSPYGCIFETRSLDDLFQEEGSKKFEKKPQISNIFKIRGFKASKKFSKSENIGDVTHINK